jgi:hypothetical protein
MNFNKIVRFLLTISNDPDLEYTQIYIKISSFKSLIYINYFYIFSEIPILKTILVFLKLTCYAVDLRRLVCEQVVCLIGRNVSNKYKRTQTHSKFIWYVLLTYNKYISSNTLLVILFIHLIPFLPF